jgi:hypothetical protein
MKTVTLHSSIVFFNRPYGTLDLDVSQFPEINLWAIFILSLRDKTSASKLMALGQGWNQTGKTFCIRILRIARIKNLLA